MSEARLKYWIEWRKICALQQCSPEARLQLGQFVAGRFGGYARMLDPNADLEQRENELPYAWVLFEEKMLTGLRKDGKHYKDWLFGRIEGSNRSEQYTIESGVSMRLWDFARTFCAHKRERPIDSLDDPDARIPRDLLTSQITPAHEAAFREMLLLGEKTAKRLFPQMDERDRMTLVAKGLDLKFSHPAVEAIFECKRNTIYDAFKSISNRYRELIDRELPGEEVVVEALLSVGLSSLVGIALSWGKSEKCCEALFLLKEHELSREQHE